MDGRDALGDVYVLIRSIDEYPFPADLDAVARAGRPAALEAFLDRAEGAFRRAAARKASQQALDRLAPWLDPAWIAKHAAIIARGAGDAETLAAITAALPTLVPYQTFRIRASRLGETEFGIFGALRVEESALEALPADDRDTEVRRILAREARLAWKARLELAEPALLYDAAEIESRIKALAKADREMRRLNRELLIHGLDLDAVRPPREWEDITRLRGQRARRLREFIDRGSDLGLMTLRPVWLMNPDVASRVLQPKAGMFDTVIYDEASQMPVEHALPSLFRGRVLVVSGDEKQMPPTAFFSSKVESDEAALFDGEEMEDAATEEEREALSDTWNRREIKDCPDLLQLARTVLPTTTLQIHYRSVYRELIGFSNASFYGNRLSVPARHPDDEVRRARPIELVRADGTYAEQTNPTEAGKVIEVLADLWKAPQPPSVGVVTFNRKQADVIEEFLEDRAEEDPAFRQALMRERDRMEAGEDMGFFVKNVENVQGDERDVIIFSSTFGRNGQGTFRRHFGVLGQAGGERRLNVAVTRARAKIVMVTSMPIAEISDLLSTRRAPAIPRDYLQAYLEYARAMSSGEFDSGRALLSRLNGERAPQRASGRADHDGFCQAVEAFLRERGWDPVANEDGGAFSLDFAIADPRTGHYGIGIECDGPRHRILEAARAREVWRPEVLRRAIPHLHRVSSRAWLQAGDEERRKLQSAVERALAQTEAGP
jgi:primosomal replication protein N''